MDDELRREVDDDVDNRECGCGSFMRVEDESRDCSDRSSTTKSSSSDSVLKPSKEYSSSAP